MGKDWNGVAVGSRAPHPRCRTQQAQGRGWAAPSERPQGHPRHQQHGVPNKPQQPRQSLNMLPSVCSSCVCVNWYWEIFQRLTYELHLIIPISVHISIDVCLASISAGSLFTPHTHNSTILRTVEGTMPTGIEAGVWQETRGKRGTSTCCFFF